MPPKTAVATGEMSSQVYPESSQKQMRIFIEPEHGTKKALQDPDAYLRHLASRMVEIRQWVAFDAVYKHMRCLCARHSGQTGIGCSKNSEGVDSHKINTDFPMSRRCFQDFQRLVEWLSKGCYKDHVNWREARVKHGELPFSPEMFTRGFFAARVALGYASTRFTFVGVPKEKMWTDVLKASRLNYLNHDPATPEGQEDPFWDGFFDHQTANWATVIKPGYDNAMKEFNKGLKRKRVSDASEADGVNPKRRNKYTTIKERDEFMASTMLELAVRNKRPDDGEDAAMEDAPEPAPKQAAAQETCDAGGKAVQTKSGQNGDDANLADGGTPPNKKKAPKSSKAKSAQPVQKTQAQPEMDEEPSQVEPDLFTVLQDEAESLPSIKQADELSMSFDARQFMCMSTPAKPTRAKRGAKAVRKVPKANKATDSTKGSAKADVVTKAPRGTKNWKSNVKADVVAGITVEATQKNSGSAQMEVDEPAYVDGSKVTDNDKKTVEESIVEETTADETGAQKPGESVGSGHWSGSQEETCRGQISVRRRHQRMLDDPVVRSHARGSGAKDA